MRFIAWPSRLYWQIFLLVWIANLAIGFTAALLITLDFEKEQHQERIERQIERAVTPVLRTYLERGRLPRHTQARSPHLHKLTIYDLVNQQRIWQGQDLGEEKASFILTLNEVQQFKIDYPAPPAKINPLHALWQRGGWLRSSVSLVIISLFSIAITFIVTTPIKQLKRYVNRLAEGELATRVNPKICQRRDEIGQLANSIDYMAEQISQLVDDKQQLLYDVSHELKAPLARMQVANQLSAELAPEIVSYSERIDKDIVHLTAMLDELLHIARMDVATETQNQPVELGEFFRQLIASLELSYPDRCHILSQPPVTLYCNETLLHSLLNNLIINGLKHTTGSIDISWQKTDTGIEIHIRDHGDMLTAQQLLNLNKPFSRGKTTSSGMGLGLTIAHKAASRLKAQLTFDDHPQQGIIAKIIFAQK